MSSAKISRRHGIKWSDEKYSEPSSTLVLSAPSGDFVDIRLVLKDPVTFKADDAETASYKHTFEPNEAFDTLEWAIAGRASYEPVKDAPESHQQGTWTHWIDSRSRNPSADHGRLQPLDNGSTLETGTMEHPETKVATGYREIWTDVPLRVPPATAGAQVAGGERTHAVLKLDAEGTQGLVIWCGQYCQGVARTGTEVAAERWEYDFKAKEGKGEWVRTFRVGDAAVPCGFLVMEAEKVEKDAKMNVPEFEGPIKFPTTGEMAGWVVVEEDFTE